MPGNRVMQRVGVAVVLVALAFAPGCTYLRHRGDDAKQMADLGVTWTKTPYLSVHGCAVGLMSAGAGHVNGHFAGLGGDQFGATRVYYKSLGLILWSYDELGWHEFDVEKPETLYRWHIGPIGWAAYPRREPPYALACTHFLHFGYAGLAANFRYVEMLDFLLGWTTLDLCGDDGKAKGKWPWRGEKEPKPVPRPKLPY